MSIANLPRKKITIRDVAAAAGASVGSVSRVLNGGPNASRELNDRVMRAVAALGYEPDSVAQSMRLKSTKTIGCLLSDIGNPIYAEYINALEDHFQQAGYLLMLITTRHDPERENAAITVIRRRRMDGLVIIGGSESHHETNSAIEQLEVPVVFIDRDIPAGDAICIDHRGGAVEATRHLLSLGHKRIALLVPGEHVRPARERVAGYRWALEQAGLAFDPALVSPQRASTTFAFSEACSLFQMNSPPTAIITLGTHMLAGVMKAAETLGLAVPDDMSIVSVGDTDLTQFATPPISSLRWDVSQVGTAAAELLLDRLTGKSNETSFRRITLPSELVIRRSGVKPKS
jgi:LacI family transcriptional regulator